MSRRTILLTAVVVVAVIVGVVVWQMQPSADRQRVEAVASFAQAVVDRDTTAILKYAPDGIANSIDSELLTSQLGYTPGPASIESRDWSGSTLTVRGSVTNGGADYSGTLTLAPAGSDAVRMTAVNPGYDPDNTYFRLSRESTGWKITGFNSGSLPEGDSDWFSPWNGLEGGQ